MKEVVQHIQERLLTAEFPTGITPSRKNNRLFEYVDIDWGQVDFYGDWPPPVKFPAALIDLESVSYSNEGKGVQMIIANIQVRIVELVLSNSSGQAPQGQKDRALRVFDIVDETNRILHAWTDSKDFGPLTRQSLEKVNRPDGIKEYRLVYQVQVYDVTAKVAEELAAATPIITVKRAR